ncbi:hypothetical protein J6590_016247 [Homalodisca vitripennis]|nr:hypothetical protein J6590_016247 [Homalodisca vitripennis]
MRFNKGDTVDAGTTFDYLISNGAQGKEYIQAVAVRCLTTVWPISGTPGDWVLIWHLWRQASTVRASFLTFIHRMLMVSHYLRQSL